jgi:predicted nucleic acid-binding protein
MVLVDTSVWIRFLHGELKYGAELGRLLDLKEVAWHEFVYGELMAGDSGGRKALLHSMQYIDRVEAVTHDEAVAFAQSQRLGGTGLSWVDIHLLAACRLANVTLWTADKRLESAAVRLRLNYRG